MPISIPIVILAGGAGRRMGGVSKGLLQLAGRPVIAHIVERALSLFLSGAPVWVNANDDAESYRELGFSVVSDSLPGRLGPLAGILCAMEIGQKEHPESDYVLTLPVDTPFLPRDLPARLWERAKKRQTKIVCAESKGRTHPVAALWHKALASDLLEALEQQNIRKIEEWTSRYECEHVAFSGALGAPDPFFNLNHPEDYRQAQEWVESSQPKGHTPERHAPKRHAPKRHAPKRNTPEQRSRDLRAGRGATP